MIPMSKDKELEMLGKLAPLNILSDKEREQLLQEVSVERLNQGGYLFREGDTDPENVYLLSGKVSLLKGKNEVEVLMGNTDTARFALAHQFPRQHTARAKSRIEYVRINSHRLSELVENARIDAYKAEKPENTEAEDWKSLLLQSRIFQLIPRANIQHVMNRMQETVVSKDEEIIHQGEEGDYFYFISKGCCSISQKSLGSRQIELAQLGPGDSFGEDALLSDNLRSSTVMMLTDGVLMRLSKDDFINFIKYPLATTVKFTDAHKITAANGVWLDIRSPEEYQQRHMGGSINLPLNSLRFQVSSLVPGRQYVIYCQDGHYSAVAAYLLLERGFDAAILSGGVKSIPEEKLIYRDIQSQEHGAKVVNLRPGVQAETVQYKQLMVQRDEADARAQTLENRLCELREAYKHIQQKHAGKVGLLEQQLNQLRSEKKEQEAELEILLTTAQEQDQIKSAELQSLQSQLEHLQQQLVVAEEEKEKTLRQLEEQFMQSNMMGASTLICADSIELDGAIQLQAGHGPIQATEELQENELALQNALSRLEEQTVSTIDVVDQEVLRQELEQLRLAIKERSNEMEQAIQEQRSLEDALEDRDAHLELVKQEMEQQKVKLESTTMRYAKAVEAHRHAEVMIKRLKKQSQAKQVHKFAAIVESDDTGWNGRQIKTGFLGMLMGGLICFFVLNVLMG